MVKKSIKSVKDLLWAWQYQDELTKEWIQFDCTECLVIEYSYQVYSISKNSEFRQIQILSGTIDFDTFMMAPRVISSLIALVTLPNPIKVRRTTDNKRKRPNGSKRHDPFGDQSENSIDFDLISGSNLEWMSINYRKRK